MSPTFIYPSTSYAVSAFCFTRENLVPHTTTSVEQRYRFYSYGDCMLIG